METALYERVQALVDGLVKAAESEDDIAYGRSYAELEQLCAGSAPTGDDDPFLRETLADFTLDDELALDIYDEALGLAMAANDKESQVSILLAIAERYRDLDDAEAVASYAAEAVEAARQIDDPALKDELAKFLDGI